MLSNSPTISTPAVLPCFIVCALFMRACTATPVSSIPAPILRTASDTTCVSIACVVALFAISDIDFATSSETELVSADILSNVAVDSNTTSDVLPTFTIKPRKAESTSDT